MDKEALYQEIKNTNEQIIKNQERIIRLINEVKESEKAKSDQHNGISTQNKIFTHGWICCHR